METFSVECAWYMVSTKKKEKKNKEKSVKNMVKMDSRYASHPGSTYIHTYSQLVPPTATAHGRQATAAAESK
jgi:hypothetical protein